MPRFIDADAMLTRLPNDLPYKASVKRVLTLAPTEDVVPRAEVAREIFAEIESMLVKQEAQCENKRLADIGNWIFHEYLPSQISELKKKYTGDTEDDQE